MFVQQDEFEEICDFGNEMNLKCDTVTCGFSHLLCQVWAEHGVPGLPDGTESAKLCRELRDQGGDSGHQKVSRLWVFHCAIRDAFTGATPMHLVRVTSLRRRAIGHLLCGSIQFWIGVIRTSGLFFAASVCLTASSMTLATLPSVARTTHDPTAPSEKRTEPMPLPISLPTADWRELDVALSVADLHGNPYVHVCLV